ncbi:hypothetical protein F4778DRAFT_603171 [Xylariomycetidae sp. FL2044]|nr:hypothetical protein F4778DRAFT_603171 [Xylariomycetidae sp. FL2044]
MDSSDSRARRAVLAVPFIGLAVLCLMSMDTIKLISQSKPFLATGRITWESKDGFQSMPIFDRFYGIASLDDLWRGITVTFSAAYIPLDSISSWQLFSFLHDLGPLYSVWMLESCRAGSVWTPAYPATIYTFVAQLLGIGNVAPIYYFLHVTFAPSALALRRSAEQRQLRSEQGLFLLPTFLGFHTFEVVRAFVASEAETRQYWIWAWQMTPLWIGIFNTALSSVTAGVSALNKSALFSPRYLLAVMGAVSTAVWVYTLYSAPHPASALFIPDSQVFTDFIRHTRKALQCDEVFAFGSSFLWLIYMFVDLYAAELIGIESLVASALLPLLSAATGPGSAFALGWYWREQVLSSSKA